MPGRLTELRLYRAQLKGILSNTLYFLEIQAVGKTLHKIGVTRRLIEERVTEVQRDLSVHFEALAIKVIGTWLHRGNVEKYFKHRYHDFNYPIGSLTEYYKFNSTENIKVVLRDLHQMKPKTLCQSEMDIVESISHFNLEI